MFARFIGRGLASTIPSKEETPEQEETNNPLTDATNKVEQNQSQPSTKKSIEDCNNEQEVEKRVPQEASNQGTKVEDIELDLVSTGPFLEETKVASGWVFSYDKRTVWPAELQGCLPPSLSERLASREVKRTSLDKKMIRADEARSKIIENRVNDRSAHNNHVAHVSQLKKDVEATEYRQAQRKLAVRLSEASNRRQGHLDEKRYIAKEKADAISKRLSEESSTCTEMDSVTEEDQFPIKRMESAIQFHSQLMTEISRRAAKRVERAREVASEVTNKIEANSEMLEYAMNQRLHRAEVRRNIILDRKRLAAGRHGNYVKSVYLTNRYMERRTSQMIQHNLDAAAFRREVKIEEIKSNARQHNLSAQFRACCAYRLFDAKWLNKALRSTAAQTTAKMRRDVNLEELMKRLNEAEVRRNDVRAQHKFLNSKSSDMEQKLQERLNGAQHRRESILFERKRALQERAAIIKSRKAAAATKKTREMRRIFHQKLEDAACRRAAFLERRRAVCAARNWHAKILAHRRKEEIEEIRSVRIQNYEGKLEAAAHRRAVYIRPIFAELVSLRAQRAAQYIEAEHEERRRYAIRLQAFDKIRLASIHQMRLNKIFERLEHVRHVQERKERMDSFRKQCISSTIYARLRTAEIRRALYQDAVKASAEETINRAEAVRERLHFRQQNARNASILRQKKAEYQRAEYLSERVSSALWFLGKVAMAQKRVKNTKEKKRNAAEEAIANAELRRSIELTKRVQGNAQRRNRWRSRHCAQKAMKDLKIQETKTNSQKASARREAALLRRIEVARCASNRVRVARLEKRAEDVVDAAIRTAIQKTMVRNAEARRQVILSEIQNHAAIQYSHARAVAEAQKELNQVRAEATLENCKLRLLKTTKRRDELMTQRKLGQSTIKELQPYAGLQVIGHAMPILTQSPHVA